jgi:hypothetical protein
VADRDLRGAELARRFLTGVVEPLLSQALPGLRYAAARLGSGSDVLGLDDEMSRDHDWGCRLTLLVDEDDRDQVPRISRMLEHTLAAVRTLLAWYPADVELYVLAAGWQRLCQSLPMVGRSAEAGDELGSRLLSAGLAGDLLWLAFTLSRRWAPYAKWRGTAFRSLSVAARLGPLLDAASAAPGWRERENALATACEVLLDIQREQVQPAAESAVIPFFDRPYRTVDQAVPQGLLAGITDPDVARLPPMVGSIEQWVDCTDVLSSPGRRAALQTAYRAWATPHDGIAGGRAACHGVR